MLSTDLLDLLQPDGKNVDLDIDLLESTDDAPNQKLHSDHDYFAQRSPGQHSDSGISVNSLDLEDSYLPVMAVPDTIGQSLLPQSTRQSESSMSPYSDSNSDSNHLGLEDFDFSSCMDFDTIDSGEDLGLSGTIDTSCLKDTDVSINFGEC